MTENYFPKLDPDELCEAIKLCGVRGENVAIKRLDGSTFEIPFERIANADAYDGFPMVRTYASGHVFIDETKTKVFLVSTERDGKVQHQFTGGSPMEEINRDVIFRVDGKFKFHLDKVEDNAVLRTLNRTGARVVESYNEIPLVDWVCMEWVEAGKRFYKLICLMHFIVKRCEGTLMPQNGVEYVTWGDWYDIESLPDIANVSPNAYIVSKKALEVIDEAEWAR